MKDSFKKPLIILGVILLLFGIGYALTQNIALSVMIALIGMVILK